MRTALLWISAPVIAWIFVHWQTKDVAFAFWMASIPASWAVIHIYQLCDTAIRKRFYAGKSRVLFQTAAIASPLVGRLVKKDWVASLEESSNSAKLAAAKIPTLYGHARIRTKLTNKLEAILKSNGAHLVITGGDGYPIHAAGYGWRTDIESLLENDCSVVQYVSEPTAQADDIFKKMEQKYDKFEYRPLARPSEVKDEEVRHVISTLRTYHPTIAWNEAGEKMLWLERYHPPMATVATGCSYYSPDDLALYSELFSQFQSLLDLVWEHSRAVYQESPPSPPS